MQIRVTGKNIDIGDALRRHVLDRLEGGIGKYFDSDFDGHMTITKEGHEFRTDCSIHLRSGIHLQSQGRSEDPHTSVDMASDRLATRMRRYKRRLTDHHTSQKEPIPSFEAVDYVIAAEIETPDQEPADLQPVIIAEERTSLQEMTVGEAVMQMDLSDKQFLMFRNAAHRRLNVVYRRHDGNIGWIDPPKEFG